MKTIFYTNIETAPEGYESVVHAPGAASKTFLDIIRHAHIRGYELMTFEGWTDANSREQITTNHNYINDLLETLEIVRVVGCDPCNPLFSRYFPIIHDTNEPQILEEEDALRIVRGDIGDTGWDEY